MPMSIVSSGLMAVFIGSLVGAGLYTTRLVSLYDCTAQCSISPSVSRRRTRCDRANSTWQRHSGSHDLAVGALAHRHQHCSVVREELYRILDVEKTAFGNT